MPTYDSALKRVLGEIERAQASVCPTCNRPTILDKPSTDTAGQTWEIQSNVTPVECPDCQSTVAAIHTAKFDNEEIDACSKCADVPVWDQVQNKRHRTVQ
jgi:hypothetical protein